MNIIEGVTSEGNFQKRCHQLKKVFYNEDCMSIMQGKKGEGNFKGKYQYFFENSPYLNMLLNKPIFFVRNYWY